MRVGEHLIQRGWIDAASVQRAVAEQRALLAPAAPGLRLCSLLISRGQLDPDHAARALAEQHRVAAVLQRHLEHRDRSLVPLLPGLIARTSCALPIGRLQSGELIICMRDPKRELIAAVQLAVHERIVVAVAPASQLEQLVEQTYPVAPGDEFEVDLSTREVPIFHDVDLDSGPMPMPDLGSLTLVGLDDAGVTKDHSQSAPSGQFGARSPQMSIPPLDRRATPVPTLPPSDKRPPLSTLPPAEKRATPVPTVNPLLARPATLDETSRALTAADTREAATDAAMKYAVGRWIASVLLTIKDGSAIGYRGHGGQLTPDLVQNLSIPLATPSLVQLACDTRSLAPSPPPANPVESRLEQLLGNPRFPMATPVLVGARIACVLIVGDTIRGDEGNADLALLADALGDAFARIVREPKR